jgi:uncharacterized protein (TIGR03067 family)
MMDLSGNQLGKIPLEQPSETSGRVTFGDRERLLGTWELVKMPLHWGSRDKNSRIGEWHTFSDEYYRISRTGIAPTNEVWQLDDKVSPGRIKLNVNGAEQKALYKLEGDFLTLYYGSGDSDYPKSFPSTFNYFDSGNLLILRHHHFVDVVFDYDDLTPGEASLIAKHPASVTLPALTKLTPEIAARLATGNGNLSLPAIKDISLDVARALATKKSTWLVLREIKAITPAVAAELAKAECALDLGIQELSPEVATELASHNGSLSLGNLISITPKAATSLVGGNRWLQLSGLKSINDDVATALSQHPGWLSLNGLNSIDLEAAEALAAFRGENLDLNGIDVLDIATAEVLAKVKTSIQFSLNGLKTLSPEVAAALVSGGHRHLSLQGLETLPDESLRILRRHQRRLVEGNTGQMLLPSEFRMPANN